MISEPFDDEMVTPERHAPIRSWGVPFLLQPVPESSLDCLAFGRSPAAADEAETGDTQA